MRKASQRYGSYPVIRVDQVNNKSICIRINNNFGLDCDVPKYWECSFVLRNIDALELVKDIKNAIEDEG